MKIVDKLSKIWHGTDHPFLIHKSHELRFSEIINQNPVDFKGIKEGDVVALIGDFDPISISTLLRLIDIRAIIVPLTGETRAEHDYFLETAQVDVIIQADQVRSRTTGNKHDLIEKLQKLNHAGLILFSTGTTGRPKAILHDLTLFLQRFDTPRPALRTISFLLFDHIGGINTLFHTLFNKGVVIAPESRTVESVLDMCQKHEAEVLPTTPTFLRMMLMSGAVPDKVPKSLKVITYGTERMDQPTLNELCEALPNIDFRQTFGMSEIGIVRVKSQARDSLYMKLGGEGVETKVVGKILHIRSTTRMIGYLNADSPFDSTGWYNTRDVVEQRGEFYKIVGRTGDVVNVGGLKFMASEVERIALEYPDVEFVKAYPVNNPITGQHLEIIVQPTKVGKFEKIPFVSFLKTKLPSHMTPKRVRIEQIAVGHRFKRA